MRMVNLCKNKLFNTGLMLFLCLGLQAQNKEMRRVATNDCGVTNTQAFLIKGDDYTLPDSFTGSKEAKTCNFGGTVIYAFDQMDIQADYRMEVVYLADNRREQRIVADGSEVQGPVVLEKGKEQRYMIDLPKKAYAYGQLVLVFEALKGDNAIVSELNLYSSNPAQLKPFGEERKKELVHTQAYTVDTTVCAEKVLPVYTIKPHQVAGVYNPVLSLNGTWLFNEKPAARFYEQKQNGRDWKPIVVPGQWSMQGFKVDSAGFGGYQTTFTLPADWQGKQVKLRFDGVSSEPVSSIRCSRRQGPSPKKRSPISSQSITRIFGFIFLSSQRQQRQPHPARAVGHGHQFQRAVYCCQRGLQRFNRVGSGVQHGSNLPVLQHDQRIAPVQHQHGVMQADQRCFAACMHKFCQQRRHMAAVGKVQGAVRFIQ